MVGDIRYRQGQTLVYLVNLAIITKLTMTEAPIIIQGPLTLKGRYQAAEEAIEPIINRFLHISSKRRTWFPDELPYDEMEQQGPMLSTDTVDILEGFMGVEEHIGDYALAGLEAFGTNRYRRNLHIRWSDEETKHGVALERSLIALGVRTRAQTREYLDRVLAEPWRNTMHDGLEGPIGHVAYSAWQERGTLTNYRRTRQRIRVECGLPTLVTVEERKRGAQYGVAEAYRRLEVDESAHAGVFLAILKVYLAYLEEQTLETIGLVLRDPKMPAVGLLPNYRQFLRAVLKTELYDPEVERRVVMGPIIKELGYKDKADLDRAIKETKDRKASTSS